MAKRKNKGNKKSPFIATEINKASNNENNARYLISEIGSSALSFLSDNVSKAAPFELEWPKAIQTIEAMKQDATVAAALDVTYLLIEKAFDNYKIIPKDNSPKSKKAAKFLEYCFSNLENQTIRQFARAAATFNEYGFSVTEKVFEKITDGKYAGKYKLKKLANRPQGSLSKNQPFVYENNNRELKGVYQDPSAFKSNLMQVISIPRIGTETEKTKSSAVFIPKSKLVVLNYGSVDGDAIGTSPLIACYKAFREKVLIENLETIGVTKDLGGVLELKLPISVLQKASANPNGFEAGLVKDLTTSAANAHAGEQSFFVIPSDVSPTGSPQYAMHLKGIDGTGKQYNTTDLVKERKKSILDRFGAGFLNVGNDKGGSYDLSESKQTIHYAFVERNINIIEEGLNRNIIPQLLSLNGFILSEDEMPKLKHGDLTSVDKDEFSKFIQRIASVGLLPKTPEVINYILEVGGFDYKLDKDLTQEELINFLTPTTSRSGDGLAEGKSGIGTADLPTNNELDESLTRDNSIANLEN